MEPTTHDEWLEPDGLGGFASGTTAGIRTRRYHALLLSATTPPTGRVVLVNGVDAWIETAHGRWPLSSQRYAPDVTHPDGASRLASFVIDPWPTWTYALPDGTQVVHEIVVAHGDGRVLASWSVRGTSGPCTLSVRPFLSGRDYHALHHENGSFRFEPEVCGERLTWHPYDGLPAVTLVHDGTYAHQPDWYRRFSYDEEAARGLDATEDLASPGTLSWSLDDARPTATVILSAVAPGEAPTRGEGASEAARCIRASERRRRAAFTTWLDKSADDYLVRRGGGQTIVAGYPWFTDWGRDTFIALRGLCLATGRLDDARHILLEWSRAVSNGMLPNLFPDGTSEPEFNSVDASLWYVVAVADFFTAMSAARRRLRAEDRAALVAAVDAIVDGYAAGTRFGIRADADGLLAAGVSGVQLTWMDAKVGDWVVTPRIGKPVEIQALWLNALWISRERSAARRDLLARGLQAFESRFWNEEMGFLYDVVDVDHQPGTHDATLRPNQVLALGGLPLPLIQGERARRALDIVEARLRTDLGLRSLDPMHPSYAARYEGGPAARDAVYHQGTVWPWLMGPFVEAWVRARGGTEDAKGAARSRFLEPLLRHLDSAGIGHVSEIADAESPHTPRGCPFQAWSVGELLRLDRVVLASGDTARA
jgi:predicted glycogen debranching enzyme